MRQTFFFHYALQEKKRIKSTLLVPQIQLGERLPEHPVSAITTYLKLQLA